jgi:hypothetical protein
MGHLARVGGIICVAVIYVAVAAAMPTTTMLAYQAAEDKGETPTPAPIAGATTEGNEFAPPTGATEPSIAPPVPVAGATTEGNEFALPTDAIPAPPNPIADDDSNAEPPMPPVPVAGITTEADPFAPPAAATEPLTTPPSTDLPPFPVAGTTTEGAEFAPPIAVTEGNPLAMSPQAAQPVTTGNRSWAWCRTCCKYHYFVCQNGRCVGERQATVKIKPHTTPAPKVRVVRGRIFNGHGLFRNRSLSRGSGGLIRFGRR